MEKEPTNVDVTQGIERPMDTSEKEVMEFDPYDVGYKIKEFDISYVKPALVELRGFATHNQAEIASLEATFIPKDISADYMEGESDELAELLFETYKLVGKESIDVFEVLNSEDSFAGLLEDIPTIETSNYPANFLYITRMNVDPKYHGKRIGLALLKRMMGSICSGVGSFVFLKAFPLQFEPHFDSDADAITMNDADYEKKWGKLVRDRQSAQKKIEEHYALLGFVNYGKSGFMYRDQGYVNPNSTMEKYKSIP